VSTFQLLLTDFIGNNEKLHNSLARLSLLTSIFHNYILIGRRGSNKACGDMKRDKFPSSPLLKIRSVRKEDYEQDN